MNYRHAFHAGNFADVLKHSVLITLIKLLQQKEKPLCLLDTHAGAGLYHLTASQKNQEHIDGINKLFKAPNPPAAIQDYLQCIQQINQRYATNASNPPQFYPGSPLLMQHWARPQDQVIAIELQPDECRQLRQRTQQGHPLHIHLQNGYQAFKALLPPAARRGLILLDPPYENPHEYDTLIQAVSMALKRFAHGVYAIWYPIKDYPTTTRFIASLKAAIAVPLMTVELSVYPEDSRFRLNGSGIAIINPPWGAVEQINAYLPWLWQILSHNQQGRYQLTSER